MLSILLNVKQRYGGSPHIPASPPELIYPTVPGVGVHISALEDPVGVIPRVIWAGYRGDRDRCMVAAWRCRDRGGRGVEETDDIEEE